MGSGQSLGVNPLDDIALLGTQGNAIPPFIDFNVVQRERGHAHAPRPAPRIQAAEVPPEVRIAVGERWPLQRFAGLGAGLGDAGEVGTLRPSVYEAVEVELMSRIGDESVLLLPKKRPVSRKAAKTCS